MGMGMALPEAANPSPATPPRVSAFSVCTSTADDDSERGGSAEDARCRCCCRCCATEPVEKGRRTVAAEDGRELGRLALGWFGWYPMRDEEAYREHSCRHSTMDSRRDLNGRGQGAIRCRCAGAGEYDKKIENK